MKLKVKLKKNKGRRPSGLSHSDRVIVVLRAGSIMVKEACNFSWIRQESAPCRGDIIYYAKTDDVKIK